MGITTTRRDLKDAIYRRFVCGTETSPLALSVPGGRSTATPSALCHLTVNKSTDTNVVTLVVRRAFPFVFSAECGPACFVLRQALMLTISMVGRWRWVNVVMGALGLLVAGCSSVGGNVTGTGGGGGEGAAGGTGGTISEHPDAGGVDATADGAVDATADGAVDATADGAYPACPQSIASYCTTTSGFCTPTWSDVLADVSTCDGHHLDGRRTCGAYDVRLYANGGDVAWSSYYDSATGLLLAIISSGSNKCLAGAQDFVLPACEIRNVTQPICPDASVDVP